jgi:hypothetical protein
LVDTELGVNGFRLIGAFFRLFLDCHLECLGLHLNSGVVRVIGETWVVGTHTIGMAIMIIRIQRTVVTTLETPLDRTDHFEIYGWDQKHLLVSRRLAHPRTSYYPM